jgi:hypothetical protein
MITLSPMNTGAVNTTIVTQSSPFGGKNVSDERENRDYARRLTHAL